VTRRRAYAIRRSSGILDAEPLHAPIALLFTTSMLGRLVAQLLEYAMASLVGEEGALRSRRADADAQGTATALPAPARRVPSSSRRLSGRRRALVGDRADARASSS